MGHKIKWDNNEKTVVLQEYTDGATKDDLYLLAQKSAEMLGTVKHRVHLIIDERKIKLTLNGTDMRYLQKLTPPNQGAVVMVVTKASLLYKTKVQDIGKNIAPDAFAEPYFAETIEDARKFLDKNFNVSAS